MLEGNGATFFNILGLGHLGKRYCRNFTDRRKPISFGAGVKNPRLLCEGFASFAVVLAEGYGGEEEGKHGCG
jgi:hypothetical protein